MKTFDFRPICPTENQLKGAGYRISILTDSLLRLEYEKDGHFTDNATQTVLNRDFPRVEFTVLEDTEDRLVFETVWLRVTYDKKPFSSMGLSIELLAENTTWNYGDNGRNLLGTVRTLDETNGVVHYEKGLFSREGYAWFNDGDSCELKGEEIFDREYPEEDIYFWGYGTDFKSALGDFNYLCGKTPMIPRYALGNWWSKYEKYTEKSYLDLMDRFDEEQIPITVAVIDMDWHLVDDVDPKFGSGWTGYTWNKEFFPDYRRFLKELHKRGKAVTLNLHPADGIRAFEECYERVAKRMGIDPATEQTVDFDLMDPKFVDAYFEEVMQPFEEDGVDFWWIDWQQGTRAKRGSVDPLWILNHYHYLDQLRRGKRAMIFSRYAGLGSHRYPIGFSGDTHATWESLDIQPFFTSTATNVGYGWWSHDIGGHMLGQEDTERTCRWVQFGVFSPVMRLHSSCNPFFFKEPWNLPQPLRGIVGDFMRLRHRMIPYLYSENYYGWKNDLPLMRPMYYESPNTDESYRCRNGYYFGSELVAYPITKKLDSELQMAHVHAFIPEGRWIDIFEGMVYEGERTLNLYRPIETIPVLIKAGGIVPMEYMEAGDDQADAVLGVEVLPSKLQLYLGVGGDGSYTMFEDKGCGNGYLEGEGAFTEFAQSYDVETGELTICIKPATGDAGLLPGKRDYRLTLCGVVAAEGAEVDAARQQAFVEVKDVDALEGRTIVIKKVKTAGTGDPGSEYLRNRLFELLKRCEISYDLKERLFKTLPETDKEKVEMIVRNYDISEKLKDAILELYR